MVRNTRQANRINTNIWYNDNHSERMILFVISNEGKPVTTNLELKEIIIFSGGTMWQLAPEIKTALEKIDFIARYEKLSAKYRFNSDERFTAYDNDEIISILKQLGYKSDYNNKEDFFRVIEELSPFRFQFNVSLKAGHTELIWDVQKNGERLTCGGPWMIIKRLLDGTNENLKYPAFRNYNELKEILNEAFNIYEDFKRQLM